MNPAPASRALTFSGCCRRALAAGLALAAALIARSEIAVTFEASVRPTPATGRMILYLISDRDAGLAKSEPDDGPYWGTHEPLLGVDVRGLAPGRPVVFTDSADAYPVPLSRLPPGGYRVQAVLDLHHDDSQWRREPGNLYSDPMRIRLNEPGAPARITVRLTHAVTPRPVPVIPGVEVVRIRSKLLSDFQHRDVWLRAGVLLPAGYRRHGRRRYPAVYEIPGFGGDFRAVFDRARAVRAAPPESADARLARDSFWIVLDPESGHGHTLFADSANNGPRARALVTELIPALESRYRLEAVPGARLLRGHSAGGWAALWLALHYPGEFGGAWVLAPDPVDFRRFLTVNIYRRENMYESRAADGTIVRSPSFRSRDGGANTIIRDNRMEWVLGPHWTSGQQWASWMAVFAPRTAAGHPEGLYDETTGRIRPRVAQAFRRYDIDALLRSDPAKYGALLRRRVRLIVGGDDNFFLNEAVELLQADLDRLVPRTGSVAQRGFIRVVPGCDHGTILTAAAARAFPREMLAEFVRRGLVPGATEAPESGRK